MEDYKEEMKVLFQRFYSPVGVSEPKFMSTAAIHEMFRGVIPYHPITEHDVYDVMKDMGFTQEQQILTEKKCIFEGDEKNGIPPEYDNVEVARYFHWKLYEL